MNVFKLQKQLNHPILITDEHMIKYCIGQSFHVAERFLGLLVTKSSITLFLNDLFPCHVPLDLVRFNDVEDPIKKLALYIEADSTLYVDRQMKAGFLLRLMKERPLVDIQVDTLADHIRSIKDSSEQDAMRLASKLNDAVMALVPSFLKEGVTELEVANHIQKAFLDLGADTYSFPAIVAFGDHGADPHAIPGERTLKKGDTIIIDMGCVKNGYCSDMTRTFTLGPSTLKDVYDCVHKANRSAIAKVKPGVRFQEIDEAARAVIREAGYGEYFIHRTGHGIGQDVHEPYDVSATNERVVEAGMCFSIEPGIYLEGVGGVRIEDLVLVTQKGCEVLNAYPKDNELLP